MVVEDNPLQESQDRGVLSNVKVQLLTLCSCKLNLTCVSGGRLGQSWCLMHFHL